MLLILSMMRFLDLPRVFPCFWSYPWWVSWIFQVFLQVFDLIHDEFLGISMCFSMFWSYQWYIYIYIIFIINTNNIRRSSKHLLTACHVVDLIHDEVLGSSTCFSMFLILSMMIFLEFPCVLQVFDLTNDIYIVLITNTNKIRCSSKHLLFALT